MPPDWVGRIAFILALAVALTLVGGFVLVEVTTGAPTDSELNFLSVLGGAAIAEVATYIALAGSHHNRKEDHMSTTRETPTTPTGPAEPQPGQEPVPERDEPVEPGQQPDRPDDDDHDDEGDEVFQPRPER